MSKQSVMFDKNVTSSETTGEEKAADPEEPHTFPRGKDYGYYPLTLGESLNPISEELSSGGGKFKLIRKLGWGAYSSVCLVEPSGYNNTHTRYQALKVLTAAATAGIVNGQFPEFDNLVTVTATNPNHPGYQHCMTKLGHIFVTSKVGVHCCFVMEPMADFQKLWGEQPKRALPLSVTKKVVKQILLALDYIHTECRLVHTDLKPGNLLVSLGKNQGDNVDEEINTHIKENPSETHEPYSERDRSPESIIASTSQSLPTFGLDPDLSNLHVKLGDFGSALPLIPEELYVGRGIQPDALRAPEIILAHPWSTPVDIWSLGCLVFEILVGSYLLKNVCKFGDPLHPHVHLFRIMQLLGPLPRQFLADSAVRDVFFDENGDLLHLPKAPSRTIEDCLDNYKCLKTEELGLAADFIRRCLTIDPSARPTAKELLDDEWLKDI